MNFFCSQPHGNKNEDLQLSRAKMVMKLSQKKTTKNKTKQNTQNEVLPLSRVIMVMKTRKEWGSPIQQVSVLFTTFGKHVNIFCFVHNLW